MPEWMEQRQWRFCGSGNQPWHYCLSMFGKGRTRRAVTSVTDKRPEKWEYCPWSTCLQVLLQGLVIKKPRHIQEFFKFCLRPLQQTIHFSTITRPSWPSWHGRKSNRGFEYIWYLYYNNNNSDNNNNNNNNNSDNNNNSNNNSNNNNICVCMCVLFIYIYIPQEIMQLAFSIKSLKNWHGTQCRPKLNPNCTLKQPTWNLNKLSQSDLQPWRVIWRLTWNPSGFSGVFLENSMLATFGRQYFSFIHLYIYIYQYINILI